MILGLALAGATPGASTDPRREGEALEEALDFAGALDAYRQCALTAPDRDRPACAARAEELAPQAADAFAGWTVLATVRRDYRNLSPEERQSRVQQAVDANPEGPAAVPLRVWLANEAMKRGDTEAARRVADSDAVPEPTRAWLGAVQTLEADQTRRRRLALAGAGLGAVYAGVALVRPGRLAGPGAVGALVLLGAVPAAFAWVWGEPGWVGFLVSGSVAAGAVLLAPRAPPWLSVPGTLGALLGAAGWNGWLPSLGL